MFHREMFRFKIGINIKAKMEFCIIFVHFSPGKTLILNRIKRESDRKDGHELLKYNNKKVKAPIINLFFVKMNRQLLIFFLKTIIYQFFFSNKSFS